ncbi:hypothetical protein AB0L06_01685 [Spirillospora sp. NPDC052269]
MKRITKLAMGTFTGAAVALVPSTLTGTANAGTDTDTSVITLRPDGAARAHAGASQAIHCALAAHTPYRPQRADAVDRSAVTVAGSMKCDHAVARISVRVGLYKDGRLYEQSGVKSNAGRTSITLNAAGQCVGQQDYTGVAIANVIAPPGYHPSHAKGRAIGKTIRIADCKRGG